MPLIEMKKLEIILNFSESLFIYSDEERLNQILRIPLENALKYSINDQKFIVNCI